MKKRLVPPGWKDLFHLCMSLELIIAVLYIFLAHQMMSPDIAWFIPLFWTLLSFISLVFVVSANTNPSHLSQFICFHQIFQVILPCLLFYSIQPEMMDATPQLLPENLRSPYLIISFWSLRISLITIVLFCQAQLRKYSELKEDAILEKI